MSVCDPAVLETLGFLPEADYPLRQRTRRLYCRDGVPITTPEPTFRAYNFGWAPGALNSTGSGEDESFDNDTDRPLAVFLHLDGRSDATDATPATAWTSLRYVYALAVTEYRTGVAIPPQPAYGPNFVPAVPALLVEVYSPMVLATATITADSVSGTAAGRLPDLQPGRSYLVRPSMAYFTTGSAADWSGSSRIRWSIVLTSVVDE